MRPLNALQNEPAEKILSAAHPNELDPYGKTLVWSSGRRPNTYLMPSGGKSGTQGR